MESPRSSPWAQISGSWAGSRGFLPLCIFPLTAHNSLPRSGTRTFVFKTLSNKNPINEIRSPLLSNTDQLKPSWLCILILINSSPLGSQNVGVINRVVVNQMNFQNNCWSTISVYCKCYDRRWASRGDSFHINSANLPNRTRKESSRTSLTFLHIKPSQHFSWSTSHFIRALPLFLCLSRIPWCFSSHIKPVSEQNKNNKPRKQ